MTLSKWIIPKYVKGHGVAKKWMILSAILLVVWVVAVQIHSGLTNWILFFGSAVFLLLELTQQRSNWEYARKAQDKKPWYVTSIQKDEEGWVIGFFIGGEEVVWGYHSGMWYWRNKEGTAACWQEAAAHVKELIGEEVSHTLIPTIGMVVTLSNGRTILWEKDVEEGVTDLAHYFPGQMAWVEGTSMQYAEIGDELINRDAIVSVLKKFSNRRQKG